MTNFEKIKAMTIDEVASYIADFGDCDYCAYDSYTCANDCQYGVKKFLESEVTNND